MRAAQRPLTPGWVAGSVRARQLLSRRLGRRRARELARSRSLDSALGELVGSAYGRTVRVGMDLAGAQRAVARTALWHARVLAGWAPPRALPAVRALAGWFELADAEERLAYLRGGPLPAPFELGGLASAGPPLTQAQSTGELRAALAGSAWGDPGTDDPAGIALALRTSWARRVLDSVDEATDWVAGAVALLLARELLVARRPAPELERHRPPGVGERWPATVDLAGLRDALPAQARWSLEDVDDPSQLWQAEAGWWRRVEEDARRMAHGAQLGQATVLGVLVLLGTDAWRVSAALEVAARGGGGAALEVFEAVA